MSSPSAPQSPDRFTLPGDIPDAAFWDASTRTAAGRSEDFYPERWLEESDGTRAPKSLAFGAGPRFCPGRNLAFLEAKAALAMLARNFEITLDESGGAVDEELGFVMVPRGLRVRWRWGCTGHSACYLFYVTSE